MTVQLASSLPGVTGRSADSLCFVLFCLVSSFYLVFALASSCIRYLQGVQKLFALCLFVISCAHEPGGNSPRPRHRLSKTAG